MRERRDSFRGARAVALAAALVLPGALAQASDPPDSEVNPQSGYIETTDSSLSGGNYEIRHAIRPGHGQPSQVTVLTSSELDDNGPRLAVAANGDTSVVWWRDDQTDQVLIRTRAYSSGSWGSERLVSDPSESSSHPRIASDGTNPWVAYQLVTTGGTGIGCLKISDEPIPFPQRTLLGTTSFTGDVDITISAESGHLWVTWVDSSSAVGWSQYSAETGSWSSVATQTDTSVGVDAARDLIRLTVLSQ